MAQIQTSPNYPILPLMSRRSIIVRSNKSSFFFEEDYEKDGSPTSVIHPTGRPNAH